MARPEPDRVLPMGLRSGFVCGLIAAAMAVPGVAAQAQSTATSPAMSSAVAEALPPEPTTPPETTPPETTMPADGLPSAPAVQAPPAAALPAGSGVLDSATVQRIIDRLVSLHLLANAGAAEDPDALTEAIRAFQAGAGISPSGTFDRDTVGRLTTP